MKMKEIIENDSIALKLEKDGITEATHVQEKAIPVIMEGNDVVVKSETGSGKTLAFVLPIIENIEERKGYAVLAEKIVSTIGRHQIYTVKVRDGKAYPVFKESGAITSMSEADGYIEIPGNVEYIEEESKVLVKYF